MKPMAATIKSPANAAVALAVSITLAASMALAVHATAHAKTVKKPAKVAKPSVSKVKATSFKVTWKKAKRAKGYQVKVMKGAKTVKTIKVKKKYCYATGLAAKTTYKVKVRAYNQSGKKIKYGKWSKTRSVTTKKSTSSSSSNSGSNVNSNSNSSVHTHSWLTDSCVTGATRIYYCLECGAKYTSKTDLHDHADSTGHLQNVDSEGYIYEDGKKVKRAESAQLKYSDLAYSYVTLTNTKLVYATDHCSCGAEKAHTHNWKKVSGKKASFYWVRQIFSCGWATDWLHEGYDVFADMDNHLVNRDHWKDTSSTSQPGCEKRSYYYTSFDHYECVDCGLKAIDVD